MDKESKEQVWKKAWVEAESAEGWGGLLGNKFVVEEEGVFVN